MEVEAGGGRQPALKEVLVHGDPYDFAYEDTVEQYAPLTDKTGKQLGYVLHLQTRLRLLARHALPGPQR